MKDTGTRGELYIVYRGELVWSFFIDPIVALYRLQKLARGSIQTRSQPIHNTLPLSGVLPSVAYIYRCFGSRHIIDSALDFNF